jgi:hypothetical protein
MARPKKAHHHVGTQKGAFIFTSEPRRQGWAMKGPVLKGAEVNDIGMDTGRPWRMMISTPADCMSAHQAGRYTGAATTAVPGTCSLNIFPRFTR